MSNKTLKILVSGSISFDRIMDFPGFFKDHILPDKIHNLNVSFNVGDLKENFGGSAGNIAYNLALLSERPFILATVGPDFSPAYEAWLEKRGVDLSQVVLVKKKTASAHIITDKADNQITGFNVGAMGTARGKFDVNLLDGALAIISPGNIKDIGDYARLYIKKNVRFIFDPGQSLNALKKDAVAMAAEGAEILICNDYELELIKKITGWTTEKLLGKVKRLIVTKGEKGSDLYAKDVCNFLNGPGDTAKPDRGQKKKIMVRAAKPAALKDPTGAGDAYRAGLIKGLIIGWDLVKSMKLGSAVASYAVEKYGTQNHAFGWKDLEKRYLNTYKEKLKSTDK